MAKNYVEVKTISLTVLPTDTGRLWDKPWNIIRNSDGTYVGKIQFKGRAVGGTIEMDVTIKENYRRMGYGHQALKGLIAWAIGRDGINTVEATIYSDNEAAIRLLEKNSFEKAEVIGKKVKYVRKNGSIPWIPICISMFASAGFAVGFTIHQPWTGIIIGALMGVVMGFLFKRTTDKKRQENKAKAANKNRKKKR